LAIPFRQIKQKLATTQTGTKRRYKNSALTTRAPEGRIMTKTTRPSVIAKIAKGIITTLEGIRMRLRKGRRSQQCPVRRTILLSNFLQRLILFRKLCALCLWIS